jgi:L-malate glycosyltransferase
MQKIDKIKLVHVTAHLGGGVGRALSRVAKYRAESKSAVVEERFICLEKPEKLQYIDILRESGITVKIPETQEEFDSQLLEADIVQLEWWHHPLVYAWMAKKQGPKMRLIIWAHTSGLHFPAIPKPVVHLPHAFLFTTPVSLSTSGTNLQDHISETKNFIGVVHSSGGFSDIPHSTRNYTNGSMQCGYLGSLNAAKLHPDILTYIQEVKLADFSVNFFGDEGANPKFSQMARTDEFSSRVKIRGFTKCPEIAFQEMDVFVYLLNPHHYGTTENALLEAMASGVVPVVMNNPVESSIVRHNETGLIVDSPQSFNKAIVFLQNNPDERQRLGRAASQDIRERFSLGKTIKNLTEYYLKVLQSEKKEIDFQAVFGRTPGQWFRSCLGTYNSYFPLENDKPAPVLGGCFPPFLYELSKGSVFQFLKYFPDDESLNSWAQRLNDLNA